LTLHVLLYASTRTTIARPAEISKDRGQAFLLCSSA
jgi:hypothetical protein